MKSDLWRSPNRSLLTVVLVFCLSAPEIEFAVVDGVAIEFEMPFENMAQQSWAL